MANKPTAKPANQPADKTKKVQNGGKVRTLVDTTVPNPTTLPPATIVDARRYKMDA